MKSSKFPLSKIVIWILAKPNIELTIQFASQRTIVLVKIRSRQEKVMPYLQHRSCNQLSFGSCMGNLANAALNVTVISAVAIASVPTWMPCQDICRPSSVMHPLRLHGLQTLVVHRTWFAVRWSPKKLCITHSHEPLELITANGSQSADQQASVHIDCINKEVHPYVLPDTPAVISVGMRCIQDGWDFVWKSFSRPYFKKKDGTKIKLEVKDYVPYLPSRDGHVPAAVGIPFSWAVLPGTASPSSHLFEGLACQPLALSLRMKSRSKNLMRLPSLMTMKFPDKPSTILRSSFLVNLLQDLLRPWRLMSRKVRKTKAKLLKNQLTVVFNYLLRNMQMC